MRPGKCWNVYGSANQEMTGRAQSSKSEGWGLAQSKKGDSDPIQVDFVAGPSSFSLRVEEAPIESSNQDVNPEEPVTPSVLKEYTDPSNSLLVSFRHPWNPQRFVTLYYGLSPQALERAQFLFFYGWDGFVAFQEGRPVQARGLPGPVLPGGPPLC